MKKYFLQMSKMLSLAAFVMIGLMTVVACGSDDDDNGGGKWQAFGNFSDADVDAPEYADVAAFYDITSPNSDIKSLELTESGRYIITLKDYATARASKDIQIKSRFLCMFRKAMTRNTTYGNIIEGKYTKKGDGTFELEGYGTVTITGSSDNALSIEITAKDGTKRPTLTAQRKNQLPESEATAKICRTWNLSSMRFIVEIDDKLVYDGEYKINELYKFGADMYNAEKKYYGYNSSVNDEQYIIQGYESSMRMLMDKLMGSTITFAKTGTYLVTYNNNTLAIATWSWVDEKKGFVRYSRNYEDMNDKDEAGTALLGFRGSQLAIQEDMIDQEVKKARDIRKTRAHDEDDDDWDDDDWDDDDYYDDPDEKRQFTMITYCDESK